jgi:hypothetical protein
VTKEGKATHFRNGGKLRNFTRKSICMTRTEDPGTASIMVGRIGGSFVIAETLDRPNNVGQRFPRRERSAPNGSR